MSLARVRDATIIGTLWAFWIIYWLIVARAGRAYGAPPARPANWHRPVFGE